MEEAVLHEALNFRRVQESKWSYFYSLNVAVANNTTFPAIINIEEDADFLFTSITGSAYGPTDIDGVRSINASTIFPLAGTAVPSGAGLGAYADRGLMVQLSDTGKNRMLTSGMVPVETILTPGYGISKTVEQPFRYYALRNSKITVTITNRDTTADLFHFLSLTAYGFKYNLPRGM